MAVTTTHGENQLLVNLDKLHTTKLGVGRIQRNLSLWDVEDIVSWCIEQIKASGSEITREGKNWYVLTGGCRLTVNAYSYTIITAHRLKT
mgnify:FL=1